MAETSNLRRLVTDAPRQCRLVTDAPRQCCRAPTSPPRNWRAKICGEKSPQAQPPHTTQQRACRRYPPHASPCPPRARLAALGARASSRPQNTSGLYYRRAPPFLLLDPGWTPTQPNGAPVCHHRLRVKWVRALQCGTYISGGATRNSLLARNCKLRADCKRA
jgi:hypothetical protein